MCCFHTDPSTTIFSPVLPLLNRVTPGLSSLTHLSLSRVCSHLLLVSIYLLVQFNALLVSTSAMHYWYLMVQSLTPGSFPLLFSFLQPPSFFFLPVSPYSQPHHSQFTHYNIGLAKQTCVVNIIQSCTRCCAQYTTNNNAVFGFAEPSHRASWTCMH